MKVKAGIQDNYSSRNPAFSFSQIKSFFKFTNSQVSLVTALVSFLVPVLSGSAIDYKCHLFIFLSTCFIYNFDHSRISAADQINSPERSKWFIRNSRLVKSLNGFCVLAALILILSSPVQSQMFAFSLLPVCLLYSLNERIKHIPGMKSLIISMVWSSTCILLPALWYQEEFPFLAALLCAIAAFINTLFFDLRDYRGDKLTGQKSLPVYLGLKKTRNLIRILCLILISVAVIDKSLIGFALLSLSYLAIDFKALENQSQLIDSLLILSLLGLVFQA